MWHQKYNVMAKPRISRRGVALRLRQRGSTWRRPFVLPYTGAKNILAPGQETQGNAGDPSAGNRQRVRLDETRTIHLCLSASRDSSVSSTVHGLMGYTVIPDEHAPYHTHTASPTQIQLQPRMESSAEPRDGRHRSSVILITYARAPRWGMIHFRGWK